MLGPYDAGKTSLMASFFLQIANGHYGALPYRFASSRTLYGFQDLVDRANRWSGKQGEQVVEHTPKEEPEDPGRFLHIGLRPSEPTDDRHLDILLTDVAGEWIEEWTRRADESARRRLAFVPRSDGFLVVVDASALLGPSGGKMDAAVGRLIRRIVASAGEREGRGLALVFSKFDRVIDQIAPPEETACQERSAWGRLGKVTGAIWGALERAREARFHTSPFAVSAFPRPLHQGQPAGVMAPFTWLMALADRRDRWPRPSFPIPHGASPFQAMRRSEAEP
ncbi:TRAFAC clade GTPase domain-containing protein [Sorangium sp. So ce1097]|uniref:TRAFAC clade GTPase domain-containing protein n=1 Tax=Sorangium sp. So ce1097 TaxID=3133330 RepID=UPI003F5E1396